MSVMIHSCRAAHAEKGGYGRSSIKIRLLGDLGGEVHRMRTIHVIRAEDGHTGILFVHRCYDEGNGSLAFCLVHKEELLEKGTNAPDYGYEFCPQSEIAGFLIADTALTLTNLYELIADVLYEASFFGCEQEHLEAEMGKLDKAVPEVEEGRAKLVSQEEIDAALEAEFGFRRDKRTEDEEAAYVEALRAVMEYSRYSRNKEIIAILDVLRTADKGSQNGKPDSDLGTDAEWFCKQRNME